MQEPTDVIISKLLGLRLTKFGYGFVLGLQGHEPTPEQRSILRSIVKRYPTVWGKTKEQNNSNENTTERNGAPRCERAI